MKDKNWLKEPWFFSSGFWLTVCVIIATFHPEFIIPAIITAIIILVLFFSINGFFNMRK